MSFSVAPNDPDVGDTHSCVVTTSAAKGTASFTGTDCATGSYVPGAGQTGAEFGFVVTVYRSRWLAGDGDRQCDYWECE